MHARSTTIHGDPGSVDAATTYVHDEVMPAVRAMDGCVGLSMLADRDTGRCIVTTSWRDGAAMRASREGVRSSAERTAELLGGVPELQEWEIAAMHRVLEAGQGARSRVTWLRTEPDAVQRAVDAVRLSLMAKLDDLPGFCSVSLMVDRGMGKAVTAVTYADRESLERSRDPGKALRDEFTRAMGSEITEIADRVLVLHHLRVPEMA